MTYQSMFQDDDLAGVLSEDVRGQIANLPIARRNLVALRVSALLTEAVAYDLASEDPPESTAMLILASAELDRHVDRLRRRASNLH
ncbi:MAG: hypothetical protein ABJL99_10575 [Aliishimia sp.]